MNDKTNANNNLNKQEETLNYLYMLSEAIKKKEFIVISVDGYRKGKKGKAKFIVEFEIIE